jgi:hypothetical protein
MLNYTKTYYGYFKLLQKGIVSHFLEFPKFVTFIRKFSAIFDKNLHVLFTLIQISVKLAKLWLKIRNFPKTQNYVF